MTMLNESKPIIIDNILLDFFRYIIGGTVINNYAFPILLFLIDQRRQSSLYNMRPIIYGDYHRKERYMLFFYGNQGTFRVI